LAQLRAIAAIEPVLTLLSTYDSSEMDDWLAAGLPLVFAAIGPEAIPSLRTYLNDEDREYHARALVASALSEISLVFPVARAECMAIIAGQFEQFEVNEAGLNGFLIYELVQLKAVE
jgi:hypothetical protein